MTYDWHGTIRGDTLTASWFVELDERWIRANYPYLSGRRPFDLVMTDSLTGRLVLETGSGMGFTHTAACERGGSIAALDFADPAIEATRARMKFAGIEARVEQSYSERLPSGKRAFDLVWSWRSNPPFFSPARIVREIARVVTPDGKIGLWFTTVIPDWIAVFLPDSMSLAARVGDLRATRSCRRIQTVLWRDTILSTSSAISTT